MNPFSCALRAGRVIDGQIMHPARVLRQPADSCLSSGGLETKPTKIQASGGRKPPDSIDDCSSLINFCFAFLFFTSRTRHRRTNKSVKKGLCRKGNHPRPSCDVHSKDLFLEFLGGWQCKLDKTRSQKGLRTNASALCNTRHPKTIHPNVASWRLRPCCPEESAKEKLDLGYRIVIQSLPRHPSFATLPQIAQYQCPCRMKSASYRHG